MLPGDLLFDQPSAAQARVTPYEYSPSPAPLPAVALPVSIPEVPAIAPVAEGTCEDDEDMYFAKLALERMLFGKTAPTEDIEDPEQEPDGPRPFRFKSLRSRWSEIRVRIMSVRESLGSILQDMPYNAAVPMSFDYVQIIKLRTSCCPHVIRVAMKFPPTSLTLGALWYSTTTTSPHHLCVAGVLRHFLHALLPLGSAFPFGRIRRVLPCLRSAFLRFLLRLDLSCLRGPFALRSQDEFDRCKPERVVHVCVQAVHGQFGLAWEAGRNATERGQPE